MIQPEFSLSTHREYDAAFDDPDDSTLSYFQYEALIAALSIAFFRFTVRFGKDKYEPLALTCFFSILLAGLAFFKKNSYELISAVELFSYSVPYFLFAKEPILLRLRSSSSNTNTEKQPSQQKLSSSQQQQQQQSDNNNNNQSTAISRQKEVLLRLLLTALSAIVSFCLAHLVANGQVSQFLALVLPSSVIKKVLEWCDFLVPITEIYASINIMTDFSHSQATLYKQLNHLLFVTFHIQAGMGFLGIDFLRREQDRRNQLVRMDMRGRIDEDDDEDQKERLKQQQSDQQSNQQHQPKQQQQQQQQKNGSETTSSNHQSSTSAATRPRTDPALLLQRAKRFQRGAAPFILFNALPYMIQIITFGNINNFAFSCVRDDLHRMVRLHQLFDHDNHLTALARSQQDSAMSPEQYAEMMSNVVDTAYQMVNRKVFSLPKILLLPAVMSQQPWLIVEVFPFIMLSDYLKATAVSYMTTKIEELQKQTQELTAIRTKVESFDIKNAELLRRSGMGATQFTRRRWEELTVQVQDRKAMSDLLTRSKGFFAFIQRNFIFSVLIDCALANLIAVGKIMSADTFVFSRAIEDAVDMLLMRSRSEAELARMMTDIEKLDKLANLWSRAREERLLLPCSLAASSSPSLVSDHAEGGEQHRQLNHHQKRVIFRNLQYNRGTANVRIDHMELVPGIYALTGANGSGKSTLFRVIMSCSSNEKSIDLPPSINMCTPFDPLEEVDDIFRAMACDAGEKDVRNRDDFYDDTTVDESNVSSSSSEVSVSMDGDTSQVPSSSSASDKVERGTSHSHPRLSITMPSAHVVEISQNFYWPLYSRPIDWIYQEHVLETNSDAELDARARKIAVELNELQFFQALSNTEEDEVDNTAATGENDERTIKRIMQELIEEKEDWFSDLSGGQKSKVELVRLVFLHDSCPDVLLIDETMAPLDPASKSLVMTKIKQFCKDSIVIVIYHTDVGYQGKEVAGKQTDCVPSNDFFDKNMHLERGSVIIRETC